MIKYYEYLVAGARVAYDKTADYVSYYTGLHSDSENDDHDEQDDRIEDYDGYLKIETYNNEKNHKRLFEHVGFVDEYTTFVSKPTHVIENIYLGSAFNAASFETLKEFNIKVIMNATSEISEYYPDDFKYIRYKLYDNNKHSIKKYLEQSYSDIKHHQ